MADKPEVEIDFKLPVMGRPMAFDSPEQMLELAEQYFKRCAERQGYPNVAGLAVSMGVITDTLLDYENGTHDDKDPNFSVTVKMLKEHIANCKLENAAKGVYNPTIAIFDLKNNHNYKDRQDVTSDDKKINDVVDVTISFD